VDSATRDSSWSTGSGCSFALSSVVELVLSLVVEAVEMVAEALLESGLHV